MEKEDNARLHEELRKVEEALVAQRSEENVLASFRGSQEYVDDVGAKSALMIQKSFLVAEEFFSSNPHGEWDEFIERFIARHQEATLGQTLVKAEIQRGRVDAEGDDQMGREDATKNVGP